MMMNAEDENEDDFALVNWEKVKATELRKACIHECAHAAVAQHFGAPVSVTITANPDASIEEKFYSGHVKLSTKLSKSKTRLVCLAGTIAEQFDTCRNLTGHDIADWIDLKAITLSETDAAGARGYTRRHLGECVALVRDLWRTIEREATQLIADEMAKSNPRNTTVSMLGAALDDGPRV